MTDTIREQILAVRKTGRTNMFDCNGVMEIANELGCYELVAFLSEKSNYKRYSELILNGR